MMIDQSTKNISVHGREALYLPYARWVYTEAGVLVKQDISRATLFIEIPGANIRKQLIADNLDPAGLLIYLTQAEVSLIPATPTPYILRDETREDVPMVEIQGRIYKTGYTIQPTLPQGFM